jgi:hypothetical protein
VEIISNVSDNPRIDPAKQSPISQIRAEIAQQTRRAYQIDLALLDVGSLRELVRLLRDLHAEKTAALSRARINPWSRL